MRVLLPVLLASFLVSCASKKPLPRHEKPTRIVNENYSRDKVRHYEIYALPNHPDYYTKGYVIAFVHMKDGSEYPVPCMPASGGGIRPTLSPGVKANRTNDAWKVTTYFPQKGKGKGTWEFVEADLVKFEGALYLNDLKLKAAPYQPLSD